MSTTPDVVGMSPRAYRLVVGMQPYAETPLDAARRLDVQIGLLRVEYGFATPAEALGARAARIKMQFERAQRRAG